MTTPARRAAPGHDEEAVEMKTARRAFRALAIACLSLAAGGGCGSEPHYEHARVHGKVTYQGKPVPLGSVLFVPVQAPPDGSMQPASGAIGPDGTYELHSRADEGAILGEHKVVVVAVDGGQPAAPPDPSKPPAAGAGPAKKAARFKSLVPDKYSDPGTTPLTRKVVPGENAIDIDLTD
jgi:hypothetical protein